MILFHTCAQAPLVEQICLLWYKCPQIVYLFSALLTSLGNNESERGCNDLVTLRIQECPEDVDSTGIELQVEELGTCFPSHFSTGSYVFTSPLLGKDFLGHVSYEPLLNTVC